MTKIYTKKNCRGSCKEVGKHKHSNNKNTHNAALEHKIYFELLVCESSK